MNALPYEGALIVMSDYSYKKPIGGCIVLSG